MIRSGFGSKGSKSISSTQGGKSSSVDVGGGPDKVIRTLGGSDIKGWYDSTDVRLASLADDSDVTTWFDKGPDQTNMTQGVTSAKPHYIYDGLNGRPVLRADGVSQVLSSSSGGTLEEVGVEKLIEWSATTSAFILFKSQNNEVNQGPFGGKGAGSVPKSRFGLASYQATDPDYIRIEVYGRVPDGGGEVNFNVDNFYIATGSAENSPPDMPSPRTNFLLSYYEWQINAGETGAAAAFTRRSYNKEAISAITPSIADSNFNGDKVDADEVNTMAAKGFDDDYMRLFQNIHTGFMEGDIAFVLFSNRHYNLKERQKILKAIQKRFGNAGIN
jgi:hypothetical protein